MDVARFNLKGSEPSPWSRSGRGEVRISVGLPAVLGTLGERLRAQPELQQDDSVACVQGGRAVGRGWVCVPGELDEPEHQQSGDERWLCSVRPGSKVIAFWPLAPGHMPQSSPLPLHT